ncbi:hypothetical protein [Calothrix sp. 336/3]|uniref:hypothetical protein n=1 Tax=Calothrix sp. 336/3 TaxID=1337936 RepID=UPI0004E3198D|nr:hypothetical protein [Calothrix sp. 336/3]AKG19995.1 hypothetical protein IJ00_00530 [Calothrix sp. 336/3]
MNNKVIAATLALSTLLIGTFAFAVSSHALRSSSQESSVDRVGTRDSLSSSTARPQNDSGQDNEYIQFIQLITIVALSGLAIGALAYVSSSHDRNSDQQESFAYQAGHRDGFCGSTARPENYPGQEIEYMRGHRKGWYDGQRQPRTF